MSGLQQTIDDFKNIFDTVNHTYNLHISTVEDIILASDDLLKTITDVDQSLGDAVSNVVQNLDFLTSELRDQTTNIKNSFTILNDDIVNLSSGIGALTTNFTGLSTQIRNSGTTYRQLVSRLSLFSSSVATATAVISQIQNQPNQQPNPNQPNQQPNPNQPNQQPNQPQQRTPTQKTDGLLDSKSVVDLVKNVVKGIWNFTVGAFNRLEDSVRPLNASLGISDKGMHQLTLSMGKAHVQTAKFGVSIEELGKIQQSIISETGRNIITTTNELEAIASIHKLTGEDGGKYIADLDRIGMSISTSIGVFKDARSVAGDMGVDAVKHSQLIQSNIQKAQSYAFKDGVKSLNRMAAHALQLRMDMQQVTSFMERNATLESAIDAAAKSQVLGGVFAEMSNPLQNMYDSWFDAESAQKKLADMGKKMMYFNEKTGQTMFKSVIQEKSAREYAKINNLDFEKMMETWTRSTNIKYVNREITKNQEGLTDKQKDLVRTKANYGDLEGGGKGWYMAIYKNGEMINQAIEKIRPEDIKEQEKTQVQHLSDMAKSTMSTNQLITGIAESVKAIAGKMGAEIDDGKSREVAMGAGEVISGKKLNIFNAASDMFSSIWEYITEADNLWKSTGRAISTGWRTQWNTVKGLYDIIVHDGETAMKNYAKTDVGKKHVKKMATRMKEHDEKGESKNYDGEFTTKVISPSGAIHKFHKDDNILAARPNDIVSQLAQTSFLKGIGVNIDANNKTKQIAQPTARPVDKITSKTVSVNNNTINRIENNKHSGTIKIELTGSMKVEDPTGKTRNWDELTKNPQFISEITDKIAMQIKTNQGHGKIDNRSGITLGGYANNMFG